MQTLYIDVVDKIATYRYRYGDLVCGNSDYRIQFSFDDEWADIPDKTARFIWNGKYFDVPLDGTNSCDVPVLTDTEAVLVGVYAGGISTTTPAKIYCKRSILCGGEEPHPESGQNYTSEAQAAAAEAKASADDAEASASAARTAADEAASAVGALNPQVAHNSMRIGRIEDKLGLDGDMVKIESGYKNGGGFSADMYRYIRILKLGSNGGGGINDEYGEAYYSTSYLSKVNGVSVTPTGKGWYAIPNYGVGKCDDERYSNYIFFENGKAYYHQGCRLLESGYADLAEGEILLEEYAAGSFYYGVIGLPEPIITDISADFDFNGVIDIGELYHPDTGEAGDYGSGYMSFTGVGYIEFAYMTKEEA